MSLKNLNLNRFLFRKSSDGDSPLQGLSSSIPDGGSYSGGGGMSTGSGQTLPDNGGTYGQAGGIIAQMYLRSSNSPDRVEINPNDSFIAYNDDVPVVVIDQNGISKNGYAQPTLIGAGFVNASGAPSVTVFPTGWTSVKLSLGRYQITHNLNTTDYVVLVTPLAGTTREFSVESQTSTTFITRFYDNTGVTLVDTDHSFLVFTNP